VIPGTRPFVIHDKNAPDIKAAVIASIANNPITDHAERILFEKGVKVIPDFLCNVGGVVMAMTDIVGGSEADLFHALDHLITDLGLDILAKADKAGIPPRILAEKEIKQKLADRRTGKTEPLSRTDLLETIRIKLKM
jgi:glutamate dehydrogenase (NAD(P)+)